MRIKKTKNFALAYRSRAVNITTVECTTKK